MIILTIRSDKPEAEIGLYHDVKQRKYITWQAHRQLAETLHLKINDLLETEQLTLQHIEGIVAYEGPGSFTGLRIGLSVANAFAYSLNVPIVGTTTDEWQQKGIAKLLSGEDAKVVLPEYGAPPQLTKPRK